MRWTTCAIRSTTTPISTTNGGGEALAYALMVLAREGAAAVGDLRYYADVKGDAFATPLAQAQLGAALASLWRSDRGPMRCSAGRRRRWMRCTDRDASRSSRADYGTNYRDAAAVLTLAVEAGSNAVDREALTDRHRHARQQPVDARGDLGAAGGQCADRPARAPRASLIDGAARRRARWSRVLDAGALRPVVVKNDRRRYHADASPPMACRPNRNRRAATAMPSRAATTRWTASRLTLDERGGRHPAGRRCWRSRPLARARRG